MKSRRGRSRTYWAVRLFFLALAGIGYAFASRVADAFGTSNGATVAYVVVAVVVIAAGTWVAWKKGL
jgi:hypothetical protein